MYIVVNMNKTNEDHMNHEQRYHEVHYSLKLGDLVKEKEGKKIGGLIVELQEIDHAMVLWPDGYC